MWKKHDFTCFTWLVLIGDEFDGLLFMPFSVTKITGQLSNHQMSGKATTSSICNNVISIPKWNAMKGRVYLDD